MSDILQLRSFWTTEIYWRMHDPVEGRYPATVPLLNTRRRMVFLGLHRSHHDFDDDDLETLRMMQGPLAAALAFRAALDEAVQLLRSADDATLSPQLLTVGRHRDLSVTSQFCLDFTPTRRQAEVLTLAGAGWTNRQIGIRLGITERTVRKHLADVYDQAGVRGRAAAAAWWQRRQDCQ